MADEDVTTRTGIYTRYRRTGSSVGSVGANSSSAHKRMDALEAGLAQEIEDRKDADANLESRINDVLVSSDVLEQLNGKIDTAVDRLENSFNENYADLSEQVLRNKTDIEALAESGENTRKIADENAEKIESLKTATKENGLSIENINFQLKSIKSEVQGDFNQQLTENKNLVAALTKRVDGVDETLEQLGTLIDEKVNDAQGNFQSSLDSLRAEINAKIGILADLLLAMNGKKLVDDASVGEDGYLKLNLSKIDTSKAEELSAEDNDEDTGEDNGDEEDVEQNGDGGDGTEEL